MKNRVKDKKDTGYGQNVLIVSISFLRLSVKKHFIYISPPPSSLLKLFYTPVQEKKKKINTTWSFRPQVFASSFRRFEKDFFYRRRFASSSLAQQIAEQGQADKKNHASEGIFVHLLLLPCVHSNGFFFGCTAN